MTIQEGDMTLEELSLHMEQFIDEQTILLWEEIAQYNQRKKLYEDSYILA